jgi:heme-degrading monooxygenase HmoA
MYTRLTMWTDATDIDGGIEYLKETALPVISQQRGYRGLSASADRSAGTLHVLSVWETEADRDASESAVSKARDEASGIIGGSQRFEKLKQVHGEVVQPPVLGSALMVTPYSADPSRIDEVLDFFKSDIAPQIKAAPGFRALRNMVDRSTGKGYVGTVWDDQAALERQQDAARSRRDAVGELGVTFGEIEQLEFVFVDNP